MLWQILFGFGLLALSALLYFTHFLIFHDAHHIFLYLIGDIAFIPIEVLLVTVIIHQLLENREKKSKFEKLNMIIGTFFSEVGTSLLTVLSDYDPELAKIKQELVVQGDWTDKQFKQLQKDLKKHHYHVEAKKIDLLALKQLLLPKRDFLIRLLENQNVLEHETFTNLLWATFHLADELSSRKDLKKVSEPDLAHLALDLKRIYLNLAWQWAAYMKHLKTAYPYLFSLAMRTNPFDETAQAEVRSS
ncbi:hypothetical protein A2291_08710 [candidate division WOR-1 bacterium RIFOXYB2_FULL_42_35]|uniref:DUF4760 domain-containing protein n=1 Tax=candidate division WOR-1 bacterium RIFOXYC2_FULL_41_25 TaxID=1802586 RepID=A0A1F4TLT9_UNCSA|nr:MAG: hypothetical protein A2291_08710 [candidate division WOR-1 bacterium RIFOXYB2_FULL_42_35]OGC23084.1 MAG: hypothetical protein A2247_08610 [candidate division WOR-1 bacterium RIFOXYA2_FULL_41_14]OGC33656.1 MAG: hypothetical protein A2462_02300 [candidate division WOR-1 bacterium RIFOXYC2_FULL_41_25]